MEMGLNMEQMDCFIFYNSRICQFPNYNNKCQLLDTFASFYVLVPFSLCVTVSPEAFLSRREAEEFTCISKAKLVALVSNQTYSHVSPLGTASADCVCLQAWDWESKKIKTLFIVINRFIDVYSPYLLMTQVQCYLHRCRHQWLSV